MRTKKIIVVVCLLPLLAHGQQKTYISLDEALREASSHNSQVKMAEWEHRASHADYKQTDAVYLPRLDIGYTAINTNNPLNAFGFLLQQKTVTSADFAPDKLNDPGASRNYNAQIDAKLPLVNVDMWYARKATKAQEHAIGYKTARTKDYVAFELQKAYTQLQFSYLAKSILEKSLADIRQIYVSVNNFYEQGLVQKSDVLNAQVQVSTLESALAKAESGIHNASDGLRLLMGQNPSEQIFIVDSLSQQAGIPAYTAVSATRSDLMAMSQAVEAGRMMVRSSQMTWMPRINAFGSYGWNDSKLFRFKADSYLIGINMSWNLFSGNQNKHKTESARYQYRKMREEMDQKVKHSQMELDKTKRDLNDWQVEINQHKASVEQAREALRILANRHKEGLASTTDLLAAQAQYSQQRLLLGQAVMSYNVTYAYLLFLGKTE